MGRLGPDTDWHDAATGPSLVHVVWKSRLIRRRSLDRRCSSRVSHSQMTKTRQPNRRSCTSTFRSLCLFSTIFARQKRRFVPGFAARRHPECECQKQPCTKTTVSCRRSTTSGRPGRIATLTLNRRPWRWRRLRTILSGVVSRTRIRAMCALRSSGENGSARLLKDSPNNLSQTLSKLWRNCIPDLDVLLSPGSAEEVVFRKCLKSRRFAHR
jgi:hypothetical protein